PALRAARELADAVLAERRAARMGHGGETAASDASSGDGGVGRGGDSPSGTGGSGDIGGPLLRRNGNDDRFDARMGFGGGEGTDIFLGSPRSCFGRLARAELGGVRPEVQRGERRVDGGAGLLH